jgi:hypothetical protein
VSPSPGESAAASLVDATIVLSIVLTLYDRQPRGGFVSTDFLRDAPWLVAVSSLARLREEPRWRRVLRATLLLPAALWLYRVFPRELGPQFFQPMSG